VLKCIYYEVDVHKGAGLAKVDIGAHGEGSEHMP